MAVRTPRKSHAALPFRRVRGLRCPTKTESELRALQLETRSAARLVENSAAHFQADGWIVDRSDSQALVVPEVQLRVLPGLADRVERRQRRRSPAHATMWRVEVIRQVDLRFESGAKRWLEPRLRSKTEAGASDRRRNTADLDAARPGFASELANVSHERARRFALAAPTPCDRVRLRASADGGDSHTTMASPTRSPQTLLVDDRTSPGWGPVRSSGWESRFG